MKDEKTSKGCSNKGHWNNQNCESSHQVVPNNFICDGKLYSSWKTQYIRDNWVKALNKCVKFACNT
jgi:hypothetical protein